MIRAQRSPAHEQEQGLGPRLPEHQLRIPDARVADVALLEDVPLP